MGRLSGFSYLQVAKKMKKLGFQFYRSAKGDHEIWFNAETQQKTVIPHHQEIKEGTLRNILKQAKIDIDTFLNS